jgi:hypothetical protein
VIESTWAACDPRVPPERHHRPGVGRDELVHRDTEAPLAASLLLVVDDVAVDLAVGVVHVEVPLRVVERQLISPPARVNAVDCSVDGRRDARIALAHGVDVAGPRRSQTLRLTRRQRGERRGRDAPHAELAADLPSEPAVEAGGRWVQRADHQALLVHPLDRERQQPGSEPAATKVRTHRHRRHRPHRHGPAAEELPDRHGLGRRDERAIDPRAQELVHALVGEPWLPPLGRAGERLTADGEHVVGLFVPRRADLDVHRCRS